MQISVLGNRHYLINHIEAKFPNLIIRHIQNASEILEEDDLTFCLGYYKLIKPKYFNKPRLGVYVMHASDLPKGRGWAPINWALIEGADMIYITSFKADAGCDTGPYHLKTCCKIQITDTIVTVYQQVESEIVKHLTSIIKSVINTDGVVLYPQIGEPTINPRRRPEHSELDLNKTLEEQWNLIRACHNEDYPAFFRLGDKKIYLRYEVVDE